MVIDKIELKHYRNIGQVELEPCETVNVFYGDNAQGKTNLIEAVWMFTGNSGFRSSKNQELIMFDQPFSELRLLFRDSEREQTGKIKISNKKEYFFNDVPYRKKSEIAGHFYCVVFSPADLDLADGSPKNRRRFLDTAIAQVKPQYLEYLDQYEKVLEQRNALLKDLYRFPDLRDTIDVWDLQLAKLGTILSIYRNDYTEKLDKCTKKIYDGISGGQESFQLRYASSVFQELGALRKYEEQHINDYYHALQEQLAQDMKHGFTSVGIHRDDLDIRINGISVRSFGSRGQLRSSVLTLKLAEAEILTKITGENPVILLDDVMSELDHGRQDYILNHVRQKQVFITCCDVFNTIRMKSGKIFEIKNGTLLSVQDVEPTGG